MKKRTLAVLLCLVLVGSFAACGVPVGGLVGELLENGRGTIGAAPFEPIPEESFTGLDTYVELDRIPPTVDLPDGLYTGKTLTALCGNYHDMGVDDSQQDVVGKLTYKRNALVKEACGIAIETRMTQESLIPVELEMQIAAGSHDFDLIFASIAVAGSKMTPDGMLYSLYDIPWLNLDSDAWCADMENGLAIGGYLPMAAGAVTPETMLYTSLIIYNEELTKNLETGNLVTLVKDGEWTLEKMRELSEMAYLDLNGNGRVDVEEDQFGFAGAYTSAQAFACAGEAQMMRKDASGLPVLVDEMEHAERVYEQFYALTISQSAIYGSSLPSNTQFKQPSGTFAKGNFLFMAGTVEDLIDVSGAPVAYGILPYPKADVQQASYHSYVSYKSSAVMVPKCARDTSFAGYTLEAMSQLSVGLYDANISARVCRSADDAEMLELVLGTQVFDFACNYFGDSHIYAAQSFYGAVWMWQSSLASNWAPAQTTLQQAIENLLTAVGQ